MKKMGFGIIGCGMIAGFHAKAIEAAGGELVGCYDKLPLAAERLAKEYNATPYQNLKEMLANPAIDIVTIGTPSGAHMDPAVMAAEAGKHVIVEKPLEVTLERCDRIIDACNKAGVTLSTVFPSRFHPSSTQLKKAIDAKRFGKLTLGDAIVKWYRTQEYYDSGSWRGTWALDGGGALMNQAIHSVDLLLWLMGPVEELTAITGLLAHAAYPGYLKRIEIHGTTGSAMIEEEDIVTWDFAESAEEDAAIRESMLGKLSGGGGAADPAAISFKPHAKQFADVMKAIENGTKPLIDGYEGRRSVEVITGIYESARTGRPVRIS